MKFTVIVLLVLLLSMSASGGTLKELTNKEWQLQSFGTIGKESPLIPGTKITLEFGDDERKLEGFSGCNSYVGSYEAREDGTLSVRDIGWTEMACDEPHGVLEQEDRYFRAFINVSTFERQQNRLQLFYDDKNGVLNFVDVTVSSVTPKSKITTTWGRLKNHRF
jgi:heat shock protein HslJ